MSGKLDFVLKEIILPDGRPVAVALANDMWIQDELLDPAFAVQDDGRPRFSLLYNELSRGQWKSGGASAIGLAEAVLEPSTDVVIAAGDTDQAKIDLDNVDGYVARNPKLAALVTARGNERLIEGGSRIRVISSDAPTAWGLGGTHKRFRIICDELTVWKSQDLWTAVASATGKVKDVQTIVLSNAGFDAEQSWQWRIREAARTQPWGRLYAPPGVVASWVTPEWVEMQRALLPGVAFDRVIGNVWTTQAGDFVTEAQWLLCVDEHLARRSRGDGSRYFGGLDLGLTKDRTAHAVVHRDSDAFVLDELDAWQGTRAEPVSITNIERAIVDATRRYPGLQIAADPWQLKGSIERLRRERVRISEFVFSAGSVQKLSATLHNAITSAALRVYPDAELEREILGLRVVQTSGGWRFDHRSGGFSDRAVALAMAVQLARKQPARRTGRVTSVPRGRIDASHGSSPRERAYRRARRRALPIPLIDELRARGVLVYDDAAASSELAGYLRERP